MSGDIKSKRSRIPWVLTLGVIAVGVLWALRDSTPQLDDAVLEKNYLAWREKPILDYDMMLSIEVDGLEPQRPSVSVRGGKLVSQKLNDQLRTSGDDSYTIEGLFRTLGTELAQAKKPDSKGATEHTLLRALFDETHSIPVVFKRLTSRNDARSVVIRIDSLVGSTGDVIYSGERGS